MRRFRLPSVSPQSGFTLIEIIVVMAIIGILASMIGSSFISSQMKGRDGRRKADLKQISNALELYANDHPYNGNSRYPSHSSGTFQLVGCGTVATPTTCTWGSAFEQTNGAAANPTIYMVNLPSDPKAPSRVYHYEADPNGRWYILFARLENTEDQAVPKSGGDPMVYTGVDCGGVECNYAIASPNIDINDIKTLVVE